MPAAGAAGERKAPNPPGSGEPSRRAQVAQAEGESRVATIREVLEQALHCHRAGAPAEAERLYQQVLQADPAQPDALRLLGTLALQTGRHQQALVYLRQAVALQPADAALHCNLGVACKALGRLDEAVACYREALRLQPDFADAHANLGNALMEQDRNKEAIASYQEALRLRPDQAEVRCKLGNALLLQGRREEAAACFRRVLQAQPDHALAHHNLGIALQEQGRAKEAAACFRQALRRNPGLAKTHFRLGNACKDLDRLDEAEACYREALRLEPDSADVLCSLGNLLNTQGELDEALACYRQALALQPDHAACHGNYLLTLHYGHGNDGQRIFEEYLGWARRHAQPLTPACPHFANDPNPDRRLRIGYLGALVPHFLEPVLAARDRTKVYVVCYLSFSWPQSETARLRSLADRWHDVVGWPDERVAGLVREEQIDILVDLAGHAGGGRLLVFARKPAPVQVAAFGYPGTTGLSAIDYRVTDSYLDPPGRSEAFYTEELVRLPETAWCYRPPAAPPVGPLPALRAARLTFASYNRLAKLTPAVIALWSQVLRALPGSRLLLAASGSRGDDRIRHAFEQHGIGRERVELRPRRPLDQYLELYQDVDIGLDPFPFTGGITTCDALWMGVPVLSLAGSTCVARQGVSLLSNAGLHDWIAQNPEEVVDLARRWAQDLPGLGRLRAGLRHALKRSPLLDGRRYTRHLEEAYRTMWRRWCASRQNP
jgi:protein O-GlcNAc transferase